jgi:hypothetical protein
MTAALNAWDVGAGVSRWIQPHESILWRGRPDPSVVFAPQDILLVPFTIAWAGFAIFWDSGIAGGEWNFGTIWDIPFVIVGLYIVVGRFIVKGWAKRHTWYAITTTRAVRITKHGGSLLEVPPSTSMEIRRRRDGRHGTAIIATEPTTSGDHVRRGGSGYAPWSTELFRGTGWPGYNRFASLELAFVDVDGLRDLMSAARFVGFSISEAPSGSRTGFRELLPSPLPASGTTPSSGALRRARHWIRTRFLRRPYALWSPLTPQEMAERLARNLTPMRQFRFGFRRGGTPYRGRVSGWYVSLFAGSAGQRNSWATSFEGNIAVNGPGSWLTGTIGPNAFVPVFSAIWLGFVFLFFLGGLIGFISDAVTGHGFSFLPFVLIPALMMSIFFAMIEFGARSAQNDWQRMDRWLRSLLEVPENFHS